MKLRAGTLDLRTRLKIFPFTPHASKTLARRPRATEPDPSERRNQGRADFALRTAEELKAAEFLHRVNSTADAARSGSSPIGSVQASAQAPAVCREKAVSRQRGWPSLECSRHRNPANALARRAAWEWFRSRRVSPQKVWSQFFPKHHPQHSVSCEPLVSAYPDRTHLHRVEACLSRWQAARRRRRELHPSLGSQQPSRALQSSSNLQSSSLCFGSQRTADFAKPTLDSERSAAVHAPANRVNHKIRLRAPNASH